jgi:glutaconate CoA-transferase subunit B
VVTDLGVLELDPETCELTLTAVHPGITVDDVRQATGWRLAVGDEVGVSEPPSTEVLEALRVLTSASEPAQPLRARGD